MSSSGGETVETRKSRRQSDIDGPRQPGPSQVHRPSVARTLDSVAELQSRKMSQATTRDSYAQMMARRQSNWRRPSMVSSHRFYPEPSVPRILYENTYRLKPEPEYKFNACKVEPIIHDILESFLGGETYEAKKCSAMAKELSSVIRDRVKQLQLPRYKILCFVVIGQSAGQTVRHASRCVWDGTTDGHASASYKNTSLFATATVFASYME